MSISQIYLPTEVVILILSFVANDRDEVRRQSTLYNCCLISHQWYSAAIGFLYRKPRLFRGRAFAKFAEIVCPPIAARKPKVNLGSLIQRLDLSGLVHHSSNSLTARLLGRVRENLIVFNAPSVSFAVNSLPALSKCHNLRHLDLSLVSESLPFPILKKAISSLTNLLTLRLPRTTTLKTESDVETEPGVEWPPHLYRLQFSGHFSESIIPSFDWPPRLTCLTLKNCADLSVDKLGCLMSSPQLCNGLKRFTISGSNRYLSPRSIKAVPGFLTKLTFLSVPGDLVEDSFIEQLGSIYPPLPLELLEFGIPHHEARVYFSTESLIKVLDTPRCGLENLQGVGFANAFVTGQRINEDEQLDDVLMKMGQERRDPARRAVSAPTHDSDILSDADDDDDDVIGVYYLDTTYG